MLRADTPTRWQRPTLTCGNGWADFYNGPVECRGTNWRPFATPRGAEAWPVIIERPTYHPESDQQPCDLCCFFFVCFCFSVYKLVVRLIVCITQFDFSTQNAPYATRDKIY